MKHEKTTILFGIAALGLLAGCTQNNTGNSEPAQNSSSSSAVASSNETTSSQAVDRSSSSAAIANGGLPTVTVEEAVKCSKTNIQMQQSHRLTWILLLVSTSIKLKA